MPFFIRVKKDTWRQVEQIVAIGEGWVKKELATDIELRMLKKAVFELSAAEIKKLLSEMQAVDRGIQKMGGS